MNLSMLKHPHTILAAVAMPILAFGLYVATRGTSFQPPMEDMSLARNRQIEVGGITRPAADVPAWWGRRSASSRSRQREPEASYSKTAGELTCPKSPRLASGVSPQMDSVLEATENRSQFPERLSPTHSAARFDVQRWQSGDDAYLDEYLAVAEPGRVYDVRQPSADVPVLGHGGSTYLEMQEGESVRLVAKTLPGAPVTFTSFARGVFQNGITTITVAASERGEAQAVYTGTTPSMSDVVAGSPVTSGTVRFRVRVHPGLAASSAQPVSPQNEQTL